MKVKKLNKKKKSYKGEGNARIVKNIGASLTIFLVLCEIAYLAFAPSLAPNPVVAVIVLALTGAMWAIGAHPHFAAKLATGQFRKKRRNHNR